MCERNFNFNKNGSISTCICNMSHPLTLHIHVVYSMGLLYLEPDPRSLVVILGGFARGALSYFFKYFSGSDEGKMADLN